jgi:hypothetical protein
MSKKLKITIKNKVHGTEVCAYVLNNTHTLSAVQQSRVEKKLCGKISCDCLTEDENIEIFDSEGNELGWKYHCYWTDVPHYLIELLGKKEV